ncbi:hypothetical protein HELRODRAFT_73484 [Helobdella robusta]|uniref:Queuosine 5'-phosphate N-glycosylase/hydrolase n=1 Tax=Helobdella robusta TaxID=6412 RepID=T1G1E2_HELRO|nr:hypothetical protein HELRODRAFT_73484 [Helobdella robusta]ESO09264.1 hypothetical protein HELRODRAFT_73484 [Helobdella robusta]
MPVIPKLNPRESGDYVSKNSVHVNIKEDGIERIANKVIKSLLSHPDEISVNRWKTHELLPQTQDEFAANWIFLSDLLNFCFWSSPGKEYMVHYKSKNRTGYWSLCAALWRALDDGYDITNPAFYSKIDESTLKKIFRSDSNYDIPKLHERHCIMLKDGEILLKNFNGSFLNVVKACNNSAENLVNLITKEFTSFTDQINFQNVEVSFYKRAQILVADIWSCFGGKGYGRFHDIDTITAFADYRVPQVLNWFGALKYSEELTSLLKKEGTTFAHGDRWEIEIRGCTIHCIELIVKKVNETLESLPSSTTNLKVNSIIIDHYLWDMRREKAKELESVPYHRTESIYY